MCTAVVFSNQPIEHTFWHEDDVALVLPPGITLTAAVRQMRTLMHDLGAPRDTDRLLCFCGNPITLPAELLENPDGTPTHEQPTPDRL